jgi:hypothetical protein
MTGVVPKELQNLVELPDSCRDVWVWFLELHNNRSSNGFTENPISFSDMHAYFNLIDVQPRRWEVDLIRMLDGAILEFMRKQQEKQMKKNTKPSK